MTLARFSVRRPVFASMITLMVLVLGGVALSRLQIDLLPAIELPTLSVRTSYAGADPVVMERLVTQIVEEIVSTVPGVEELSSTSYEGSSTVKVSFGWGTSIDAVAVDVRATLEDEISELPDDIVGPRVSKFDIDTYPVVILGLSSPLDPVELTQILENQLRHRFARVPGVAQVDPWGGFNREVRVALKPERIKALGLSLDQVRDAIRDANLDRPSGQIQQGSYEISLRTPAEFASLEQIGATVIGRHQGALVRLNQVALIQDSYEKLNRIIRVNGQSGLRLAIRKQPEANTVEVAKAVLAEVERARRDFPQIDMVAVTNQGNFIQRSIANVAQSVLFGGSLAVLVLLLFLRSLRSTLIIALSIPISLVATFALLYFSGFTLNLMTLGGLALGVGMMVDSSVVVLENIFRRQQEQGESPEQAAVRGAREVSSAVVAGTLTTLVIFLPLIFIRGVSGELFKELAYVIMFALICALLVALGLLPMLAAKIPSRQPPAVSRQLLTEGGSDSTSSSSPESRVPSPDLTESRVPSPATANPLTAAYLDLLQLALRHRGLSLGLALALLLGVMPLLPFLGSEFMPPSDEGEVRIYAEMDVGTRLDLVDAQSRLLEQRLLPLVPEAVSSVTSVSASGSRGSAKARSSITISLVPAAQRERSNRQIADDLRRQLDGQIPGMKIRTRAPQGQYLLERLLASGSEGVTVEVRGYDLDTLNLLADQVAEAMAGVAGVTDVEQNRDSGVPQQELLIDRAKSADLGLSVRDLLNLVETAVAGSKVGEYRVDGHSYRILLQLEDAEQRSLDEILDLSLRTPDGENLVLRNLVSTRSGLGPVSIERKDRQRLLRVEANVSGRDTGSVAADLQQRLDRIVRPPNYDLIIAGNFEEQQKAFVELLLSLGLALLLVYMVLAAQYESLRDPLIVMLSAPLAGIGVVLTLFLTDTSLNLQSAMGAIMLGGIVVNNAILLVDQANQLRRGGMPSQAAAMEAGRRRLRPILMTSLTTILALLPLALGIGEGADAQAPMARVVLGGLVSSTLISLVLVPVVYSLLRDSAPAAKPQQ
ncbi:MAG: efflux RND transporter permease subunit [Gammaproteobacteria bacterium SHHR-1]